MEKLLLFLRVRGWALWGILTKHPKAKEDIMQDDIVDQIVYLLNMSPAVRL
jgi:hypothetical protein